MTLPEIKDSTERFLGGFGIFTDESRWDGLYMESLIHKYSRMAIVMQFAKNKRVNPIWSQQLILDFSEGLQDDNCLVKFPMPQFIQLDNERGGIIYAGTIEGNCQVRVANTRQDLILAQTHRNAKNTTRILYSDGYLEVYGNAMLEELRIDAIFLDPTQVTTYNKLKDDYPLNNELVPDMQKLLFQYEGQFMLQGKVDGKTNGGDDNATTSR